MKMDVTFSESNNGLGIKLDNGCISDDVVSKKHAWSSQNIIDKLCPSFTESGAMVTCEPVEGYPLTVTTDAEATTITRCGKNLFDNSESKFGNVEWINSSGVVFKKFGWAFVLPAGSYVLKAYPLTDLKEGYLYGVIYTFGGQYLGEWNAVYGTAIKELPKTFTEPVKVYIYNASITPDNNNGTIADALSQFNKFNFQLERGNTATEFEPYNSETFNPGETIPALPGLNTIFADAGEVTVTGKADPVAIINNLQNRLATLEAAVVNNA